LFAISAHMAPKSKKKKASAASADAPAATGKKKGKKARRKGAAAVEAALAAPPAENAKARRKRKREEARASADGAAPVGQVEHIEKIQASAEADTKDGPKKKQKKAQLKAAAAAAAAAEKEVADSFDEEDEEEDGESEDGESEDEESGDAEGDDVDVEFEFFDPSEEDYHSVGDFLKNGTWDFATQLNFAELADSLVGQGNIGTLIKSGNPNDPEKDHTMCAMLTVLNLRQFPKTSWPGMLSEVLLAKAKKHAAPKVFTGLQEVIGQQRKKDAEVGLMFNERFTNLPPQLIPPLHRSLVGDIEWSCTTPECPEDERPFYFFSHFIGVSRCFETCPAGEEHSTAAAVPGGPWFPRPETSHYFHKADLSFTFPCSTGKEKRSDENKGKKKDGRGQELRAVFVLTKSAFEGSVAQVEKAFKEKGEGMFA